MSNEVHASRPEDSLANVTATCHDKYDSSEFSVGI